MTKPTSSQRFFPVGSRSTPASSIAFLVFSEMWKMPVRYWSPGRYDVFGTMTFAGSLESILTPAEVGPVASTTKAASSVSSPPSGARIRTLPSAPVSEVEERMREVTVPCRKVMFEYCVATNRRRSGSRLQKTRSAWSYAPESELTNPSRERASTVQLLSSLLNLSVTPKLVNSVSTGLILRPWELVSLTESDAKNTHLAPTSLAAVSKSLNSFRYVSSKNLRKMCACTVLVSSLPPSLANLAQNAHEGAA